MTRTSHALYIGQVWYVPWFCYRVTTNTHTHTDMHACTERLNALITPAITSTWAVRAVFTSQTLQLLDFIFSYCTLAARHTEAEHCSKKARGPTVTTNKRRVSQAAIHSKLNKKAQLPLRNRASAMHFFVARLLSVAITTTTYIRNVRNLHPINRLIYYTQGIKQSYGNARTQCRLTPPFREPREYPHNPYIARN